MEDVSGMGFAEEGLADGEGSGEPDGTLSVTSGC